MSLQALLNEPKGKITYHAGQAFMLHVFWEAPNQHAAERVLNALQRCSKATHRDTPCVPTYFFRISSIDTKLKNSKPTTIGQHPQIRDAQKKLKVGVPVAAINADLMRRGLDPALLYLDPSTPLPDALQESTVILELTETYLDERSFYEHAGSRDYLDAYGEVMTPGLQNMQRTIRLGNPTPELVEKILAPMLQEKPEPLYDSCVLWQQPTVVPDTCTSISMDIPGAVEQATKLLPYSLRQMSTTLVAFSHPLLEDRVRILSILPVLPDRKVLQDLTSLPLVGIEIHCEKSGAELIQSGMESLPFNCFFTVSEIRCGYLIHEKAREVAEIVM